MADNAPGRTGSFLEGARGVRAPSVSSVRPILFHQDSVLNNPVASSNGLAKADYERRSRGLRHTTNGSSADTYEAKTALLFPRTNLFK